jgi:hypothetical protein
VSGRIVQEGPGPPAAHAAFRLNASVADSDLGPETGESIRPNANGAFEVSRLMGPVRFLPAGAPTGWWLKSVMIGGVNAADDPVVFGAARESRADVEVVFSSVTTGVSGRVLDRGQEGVSGAAVIAFSTDSTRWFAGSRHLKRATSVAGRFTIAALPPGDYYVAAVRGVDAAQSQEPEVLRSLVSSSTLVSVREGAVVDTDLNVR